MEVAANEVIRELQEMLSEAQLQLAIARAQVKELQEGRMEAE